MLSKVNVFGYYFENMAQLFGELLRKEFEKLLFFSSCYLYTKNEFCNKKKHKSMSSDSFQAIFFII